jgi:hypothetical protein
VVSSVTGHLEVRKYKELFMLLAKLANNY